MGYIAHEAVIVTVAGHAYGKHRVGSISCPDVEAFRQTLPSKWRPLLVGPIPSVVNEDWTFFFAPDGSKEGWGDSDAGDRYRQQFIDLFSERYDDGSTPFDVIAVRFGSDAATEEGCRITYAYPNSEARQLAS